MKLGLSPAELFGLEFFDVENLQRIKKLGFSGVGPGIPGFEKCSRDECEKVKQQCKKAGMDLVQLGQYMTNFVSPEAAVRKASIEQTRVSLERASWMGCMSVIVGSGSLNKNMWFDHKDNHTWRSFNYLVQSLKECAKAAEGVGIDLGVEPHTFTALDSPERVRDVIDAVGLPCLKINIDPVNWITYATYWDNGPYLHHMFDLLSDVIMSGHADDVRQEDGLIIHMNETYAGDGNLNFGVYLTRMAQLDPDLYLIIEHTKADLVPKARDYILAEAAKVGVSFRN
jgi:sugar phosphate isomerase/epimerase